MKVEEIIYGNCGIDFAELDEDEKIDCRKVKVNKTKIDEIRNEILDRNPELNVTEVLLLLLQYGPTVEQGQTKPVILEDGYIRKE
ncbi:hypothetical protein JCM16358_11540 [Halanaerocella petrolearia]